MNGNRQIEIPPAVPGEPIGQTLLNSLIGAANNARQITGDGGLNVSNIGGVIGLSLDTKQPARQQFLIQVQASPTLAPGFYYGKVYSQTAIPFISAVAGSTTTPLSPVPIPNAITCIVVNLAEVNAAAYGSTGTFAAAPRVITANRMAFGQFVGYMDSTNIVPALPAGPLFAVDVNTIITPAAIAYLTQVGGSNGSTASYCTYTYNAYFDAAKTQLAGGTLTVQAHRMFMVPVTAATLGPIQLNSSNTYSLMAVLDEYPATNVCT